MIEQYQNGEVINHKFSKIQTNKSKVEISKIDKETKLPISNTKIEIYNNTSLKLSN